jgi:hypothetical protein
VADDLRGIDLTDLGTFVNGFPHGVFRLYRAGGGRSAGLLRRSFAPTADERHFTEPDAFRLGRDPNPHLTFGHGVHFCLGAHLARLELRVALEEVLALFDRYELAGPVEWTRSNRHSGIRLLRLRVTRRAA